MQFDQITLSLLVTLAMTVFRWGFTEIQKKREDTSPKKRALAAFAMLAGAGFFAWMIFFRTMDTVLGGTVYMLARRAFRPFRRSRH